MTKSFNKLVRDNIPDICRANGQTPNTKILDDQSYTLELNKKLKEETEEYLSSSEIEELADIVEVVEALAENLGSSLREVMEIKQRKQKINGAFKDK
ncbi:MAG: nucleoside triphosphate pyrophosphohydrolase, partial [Clostridia bacterium]|nr:nucleoside triphosphate pyrophosphohydrolase [Butyricicoccus sp.]MBP3705452.1 nucleoside triphosphate pyrophosphohydrolase [Clostridia bacterium]